MVYIRRHYQFCSHYLFFFPPSSLSCNSPHSLAPSSSLVSFFFGAKHHVLLPAPARSTDGAALNIPVDSRVICHPAKIGIQFTSTRATP